ncbi:MAG: ribonuclease HI family protein [Candidatus Kariarchaeaceae archaeon]|jgi:ribonuclease HI
MRLLLYFDGAAKGNPGIAGAGAYITTEPANSKFEYKLKQYLGSRTNNQAEYQAIILGLRQVNKIIKQSPNQFSELIIKGDSDLIIKQLNGTYQVRSQKIYGLFQETSKLINQVTNSGINVKLAHIYRTINTMADSLANQAIREGRG